MLIIYLFSLIFILLSILSLLYSICPASLVLMIYSISIRLVFGIAVCLAIIFAIVAAIAEVCSTITRLISVILGLCGCSIGLIPSILVRISILISCQSIDFFVTILLIHVHNSHLFSSITAKFYQSSTPEPTSSTPPTPSSTPNSSTSPPYWSPN